MFEFLSNIPSVFWRARARAVFNRIRVNIFFFLFLSLSRNPRGTQTRTARGHGSVAVQARTLSVHVATGDQHGRRLGGHVEDRGPRRRPRDRVQLRRCAHRVFQYDRIADGRRLPIDRQRPRVHRKSAAAKETRKSLYICTRVHDEFVCRNCDVRSSFFMESIGGHLSGDKH